MRVRYYEAGADELIYMDIVASLYDRNSLTDIVRRTAEHVFMPITVGGGIRSVDDVDACAALGRRQGRDQHRGGRAPGADHRGGARFGSQCMVLSIEAKRSGEGRWEAYTDNGREHTGLDVVEWVKRAVELGAGEILLTSVDREGTRKGFDRRADARGLGCGARAGDRRAAWARRAPDAGRERGPGGCRRRWPTCSITSVFRSPISARRRTTADCPSGSST